VDLNRQKTAVRTSNLANLQLSQLRNCARSPCYKCSCWELTENASVLRKAQKQAIRQLERHKGQGERKSGLKDWETEENQYRTQWGQLESQSRFEPVPPKYKPQVNLANSVRSGGFQVDWSSQRKSLKSDNKETKLKPTCSSLSGYWNSSGKILSNTCVRFDFQFYALLHGCIVLYVDFFFILAYSTHSRGTFLLI
jgi:hypothetical protein